MKWKNGRSPQWKGRWRRTCWHQKVMGNQPKYCEKKAQFAYHNFKKFWWGLGGGETKNAQHAFYDLNKSATPTFKIYTSNMCLFFFFPGKRTETSWGLFVCGISLTSGQLIIELFPDCTRSCFSQVVSRHRGGDRIYEMRCLFVAVGPNARFIVLPHWDNMS